MPPGNINTPFSYNNLFANFKSSLSKCIFTKTIGPAFGLNQENKSAYLSNIVSYQNQVPNYLL